jgi:predicted transcriptional regulator
MNRKVFKVKDTLTKINIILQTIKRHKAITVTGIAKSIGIHYLTARKWANYLLKTGWVGRKDIGNYKLYYFKGHGKRFHLSNLLEQSIEDDKRKDTENKETCKKGG